MNKLALKHQKHELKREVERKQMRKNGSLSDNWKAHKEAMANKQIKKGKK